MSVCLPLHRLFLRQKDRPIPDHHHRPHQTDRLHLYFLIRSARLFQILQQELLLMQASQKYRFRMIYQQFW